MSEAPAGKGATGAQPDYAWCQRLFDQLDFSDGPAKGAAGVPAEDEPEWVWNVTRELAQQAMPSLSLRKPKHTPPRLLGLYLGQLCANFYAVTAVLNGATHQKVQAGKSTIKALRQKSEQPGVASALLAVNSLDAQLRHLAATFPKFERTLQASFKAALEQPDHGQAVEFFQGFAGGLARPGISGTKLSGDTTATLIYQKLQLHRRQLAQLPNYPALRNFLIRQGVPEGVMGSVRRLQKLCERIGLRLGKPGRPRTSRKLRHAA